jgi:hypothetical protein
LVKIETTLRYDYNDGKMTIEYFNKVQRNIDIDNIKPEDNAMIWLDKLLSKEIDLKTFKTGIDVVVVSSDGTWYANLQVKTSKSKVSFWPVGTRFEKLFAKNNYYVFVRYLDKKACFEAFLESLDIAADDVRKDMKELKNNGRKVWTPCWTLPKDEENRNRVSQQWFNFGRVQM